jgi:sugar/nucleoside kinase (ribokinase family)
MSRKKSIDCLVAGEANVDLLIDGVLQLEVGTEKLAQDMNVGLGGSSAITAFNLAMMGTRVAFTGVVGRDLFGSFVADSLACAKVDLSGLLRSPREQTGLTLWMSRQGRRAGVTYPGSIASLHAKQITDEHLQKARHLHVGAYFLQNGLHAGAAALFQRAKTFGLTTSLDCNYDPAERWDSNIFKVLRHTDIFLPNEQEARLLTGLAEVRAAARKLAKQVRIVIVKRGARGVLVCAGETILVVPAVKTRAVDTTGAGDSFNAGFLHAFLRDKPLEECALTGVKAAAKSVTVIGGTTAFEDKQR